MFAMLTDIPVRGDTKPVMSNGSGKNDSVPKPTSGQSLMQGLIEERNMQWRKELFGRHKISLGGTSG